MLRRILFILFYFIAWVVFFEAARILFLIYEARFANALPGGLAFSSLWYGLRMDLSMAAYITVPVTLFVMLSVYVWFFRRPIVYYIYTALLLFFLLLLTFADMEIYRAWGHRIDFTVLNFIGNPKEMWASMGHLPLFWIAVGFLFVFILLFWLARKLLRKNVSYLGNFTLRGVQLLLIALVAVLLIIPIRGGLQLSPLNHSTVYFSNNQFANNAALNAAWNFMRSMNHRNELTKNPYNYFSKDSANSLVNELYTSQGSSIKVIDTSKPPNVLVVLWESFTEKALHLPINGKPITPYFEQLKKEGIYFSNCYSNGDRTNKGISNVLSGYPALPKGSIVNYPQKLPKLDGLGKIFSSAGYQTNFYYGGELEFANMKGYILDQQFSNMVTMDQFAKKDRNSKWGAHDNVVMDRIVKDLSTIRKPFFTTFLTLTSHEPFETPVPTVFEGGSFSTRLFNALHFTDSCLYGMIKEMEKQQWWNETLVIIVADHGHYEPSTGKRADDYRIPMLWLGGALSRRGVVVDHTVNQLDIAGTLSQQMNFPQHRFPFSKGLFDSSARNWAFFTFNDGIGFITDSSRMIYDNLGKKLVYQEGKVDDNQVNYAKALMQVLYQDFLSR